MNIKIIRQDGGIWLSPVPAYITNYLRYSHRSFKSQNYERVNSFQEVLLYQAADGGIFTLSGYYQHIVKLIIDNKDTFEEEDYRRAMPQIDWGRVKEIGLRDYQKQPVVDFLIKGSANSGIINATGGWGKTFAQAVTYAAYNKLNTILAIPLAQVVKQTAAKFKTLFPEKHVGEMHAQADDISTDITITTFDSLQKCSLEKCELLLVDEVQSTTSEAIQAKLGQILPIRKYGYTATDSGLFSRADKIITGLFGERLIYIPYREAEEVGAVVPGVVYFIEVPEEIMITSDTMEIKFEQGIKNCKIRNQLIGEACAAIPDKWQTIVFVDHVKDHLVELMKFMPAGTKFIHRNSSKKQLGSYALSPKQQDEVIKAFTENKFQYLVATDAFRAGVDVPNNRVVIQAAGGSSEIEVLQEAYRGSRILSEEDRKRLNVEKKTHFVVIDFWDKHDETLLNMSRKRMQYYKDQGWKIHFVKKVTDINWKAL